MAMDIAATFNQNGVGYCLLQKQFLIKDVGLEMDNDAFELAMSNPTALISMVKHMQKRIKFLESTERETDSTMVGLLNHVGPHDKDTGLASDPDTRTCLEPKDCIGKGNDLTI